MDNMQNQTNNQFNYECGINSDGDYRFQSADELFATVGDSGVPLFEGAGFSSLFE